MRFLVRMIGASVEQQLRSLGQPLCLVDAITKLLLSLLDFREALFGLSHVESTSFIGALNLNQTCFVPTNRPAVGATLPQSTLRIVSWTVATDIPNLRKTMRLLATRPPGWKVIHCSTVGPSTLR